MLNYVEYSALTPETHHTYTNPTLITNDDFYTTPDEAADIMQNLLCSFDLNPEIRVIGSREPSEIFGRGLFTHHPPM